MPTFTPEQIHVATMAWVANYRRECFKRGLPIERTLAPWEELSPKDQAAIKRCIVAALQATDPNNVRNVRERNSLPDMPNISMSWDDSQD